MKKKRSSKELVIVDRIFGGDLFLQSKETTHIVAKNMNIVALAICFINATYILLTGKMTMDFLGIFTCYLPTILCIATDIFFRSGKLYSGMVFSNTTVPLAITLKGVYEPIAGIMLYPLAFGIVSFFILPTKRLVYLIYTLSVFCLTSIDIAYHYKYNQHFRENISQIIFNDLLFAFVVYTVLGYLRNLLTKFQIQRKTKEEEMVSQNLKLQNQQEEIASQNLLLQQKNQLLIESWHFQQKITSVLSHDTRTSLIFLKHILLSSKRMLKKNSESQELILELEREVSSMTVTFDNVLQWLKHPSHISEIHREKIILHDVTEEILFSYNWQAKSKEVLLVNEISSQVKINVNPEYLKVVLRNLVGNALKFSRKGGIVKLWSETANSLCKIFVADNGIGISQANLKKINAGIGFSTTGTMKETGTGMGLVFCRDFIEKSSGSMEIVSNPGAGTTIIINIPDTTIHNNHVVELEK